MAFNAYYPYQQNPYQPYFQPYVAQPQPVAQAPAPQPQVANSPIKLDTVSGRTAVDVYNVNVGEEVILFDIDNPTVYKKHRGLDSKLETQVFDLIPHVEAPAEEPVKVNLDEYMKADAADKMIKDRVREEVEKRLSEISFAPRTRKQNSKTEE
ncbi:MAG: hypothetical protein K6F53_10490 [Lachnospiraceae bacterium]|nr:hypothetical protein [Lachnospiraceae bacterium]